MEEKDIKQLLTVLRLNYPATYRDMSIEDRRALVRLWHDAFGDLDVTLVGQALKNYIKANEYPPTIAGLQRQIDLLTTADDTDELWHKLMKGIRDSGRNAREEFEKLPEECKAFVGSPAELRILGNTDLSTINTVTRGQFYKRVQQIKERTKAQNQLPEEVRRALSETLQLGGQQA